MINRLRTVVFMLLLVPIFAAAVKDESWSLLTHVYLSDADLQPLSVTAQQRQWLQHKRAITVGIFAHDSPPFTLLTSTNEYEGINADYLGLISAKLGLEVRFKAYKNPEQRRLALERGEIDVIPNSPGGTDSADYFFTSPYATEHPAIAVKVSDRQRLPDNLENVSVAIVSGYWPLSDLEARYPHARFQVYDNYQEALSAVAYGRARAYFGNGYPISRNFINNLHIVRFATAIVRTNSFVLHNSSSPLPALFNDAYQTISPEKKFEIRKLWQSEEADGINKMTEFSPAEQRWIKQHPSLNVILNERNSTAPVAFLDDSGALRGIAADVLSLVSAETGLTFSVKTTDSLDEVERLINTSGANMVAALSPSDTRSQTMLFTYPYVRTAFVLVTGIKNNDILRLSDLRGKKIGLVQGAALTSFIKEHYPEIKQVIFKKDADLFSSLEKGNIDAAVSLLITTDYQLMQQYKNTLKIVNTLGDTSAFLSFGVEKNSPELLSILNKVLISLPPDELEMLSNRWRPYNLIITSNFWSQHRVTIYVVSITFLIILSLIITRTVLLRRKMLYARNQVKILEDLINDMPFPVTLRDLAGKLTFCNKSYLALVGFPFEFIKGKLLTDKPRNISLAQATFFQEKAEETIESRQAYVEDLEIDLLDDDEKFINSITANIWMLPWQDASGKVIGVIGGLWDISERSKLLQQLKETSDRAEASNRAKSTFLSTMSHEIRTPMNAIIGMLDMAIKKGRQGDLDLQALEVAQDSAEGLVGLIGDILDLSRVEEGKLEFRPVPVNLAKLINQLLVIFNGLAIDKNIELHKHFPPEAIVDVLGDPLRIKQVLSNVLGNAIKFTDSGGVTLDLYQTIDKKNAIVHYIIDVTDSGIGIDESQQAALFQPFAQADNRRAGTGLGLYISRNLCKHMGGNLTLSSVLHQGTRVRTEISLPVSEALQPVPVTREIVSEQVQKLNILVVDDNAANRMLLAKQLAWLGHHAYIAEDGNTAINLWRQQKFDVIVTDCNMPRMNGYEFTRYIREQEKETGEQTVWIIGFTANAMPEIVERCLTAGMDGCLFKPCTINSLSEAINKSFVR